MNRRSAAIRAVLWFVALGTAALVLRWAGTGELAMPPLGGIDGLVDWADGREPTSAAMAFVRAAAEVTTWYLLVVSALQLVGHRHDRLGRTADRFALPWARRAAHAGLGLGLLAASTSTTPPTASDAGEATGSATMQPVDAPAGEPGTAVMRPLSDTAPEQPDTAPEPAPTAPPARPQGPRMVPTPATWTVTTGESLWSIADELVSDRLGRPASDCEIDPVWRALVDANRDRLVDADDADLILRGQVLEVPAF